MDNKIYIFALAAHGKGISGGDRIFMEFAKYWSKQYSVMIYVWEEGYQMLKRQHLVNLKIRNQKSKLKIRIVKMEPWSKLGFVVNYFFRIIEGIRLGLTIKLENSKNTIVYSASEFWMDSLPALFLKLRFPKIKWVAAWYQTAPNPLTGFTGSLPYWLVQLPIKPLIDRFADFVLVNNDEEKKQFLRLNNLKRAIVVLGAIDLKKINQFKNTHLKLTKKYEAVFQGRFHPQKGVLELLDIWKRVVEKKRDAKLVMIGDGPLMENVKIKIQRSKLGKNVKLTGYLFDGEEKYKIFTQSKIVLHPAVYDSGGMASYEAMAFGLPCVGFNLNSYKYYYPKGMTRVKLGDLQEFADRILEVLSDRKLYQKIAKEAIDLVTHDHSWEDRSRQVFQQVLK